MNWNLLRKVAGDRWRAAAVYAGAISAYALMTCGLFKSFSKLSGIQEFLDKYPETLTKFFGVTKFDITSFNNYMVIEMLGLMWVIIVIAFVVSTARNMVAGELHDGTLELLLSQPIERWRVLTTESVALVGWIIGIVVATVISIYAFGTAFGAKVDYAAFAAFIPLGVALFLAIGGYSIFFSVLMRDSKRAVAAAAGLSLYFYLVNFASSYSKVFEKINWFGVFHYYTPLKTLDSGTVPVKSVLVLLAFAAVFFGAALWLFERKDIT